MRIIAISPDGERLSGVATYVWTLVKHSADVTALSLDDNRAAGDRVVRLGSSALALAADVSHRPAAVAHALVTIARDLADPDIVLLPNVGEPAYLGCALAAATLNADPGCRARMIGIVHSDQDNQYDMVQRYADYCAVFVAVSPAIKARLAAAIPLRAADIAALPYPIAVGDAQRRGGGSDDPLRLIYVGRLDEEQKRVGRLAELASALAARGVRCSMTIAGGGTEEARLRGALARLSGSSVAVTFLGCQPHLAVTDLLTRHDVCVLVSAYEGQPFALLEAMAAGVCPAVMAMASGIDDLVYDGRTGVVVPQGDVDALADAIAGLDRDRRRLTALGLAARRLVESRFGVERHLSGLEAAARTALGSAAPPPPAHHSLQTVEPAVRQLLAGLPADPGRLVIYGAGIIGRTLLDECLDRGWQVVGIVDSDPSRGRHNYRGIPAFLPDALRALKPDRVLIGSVHFVREIEQRVRGLLGSFGSPQVAVHRAAARD